ncbi:MAG: hypothetical protein WD342_15815 [Verrucomicrobiales bacterium]
MSPETTSEEDSRSEFLASVLGDDKLAKLPQSDMEEEADPENGVVLSSGPDDMDLPGVDPNAAPAARSGGTPVPADGDESEDTEKKAPQSSSAAGTESASVAEHASSSEEDELLLLPCPKCAGELALRQEHVGIEGACVWCDATIVAGRSGLDRAVKVFLIATDEPAVATESGERDSPETIERSPSPLDVGATMTEPEVERAPLPEAAPSDAEPAKVEEETEPVSPPEAPPVDWTPSAHWGAPPPSPDPANASEASESDSSPPLDSSAFDLVAAGWGASEKTSEAVPDGFDQQLSKSAESSTEPREESAQVAADLSSDSGFGSTPESESAGQPEDRREASPEDLGRQPDMNFQPTKIGESVPQPQEDPSQAVEDFSFGTGFGSPPESERAGEPENRPAAVPEGFSFQPTEPSPSAEARQESPQPAPDFSFGTDYGSPPDSEGAGGPENRPAAVPDGFDRQPSTNFQGTETFQPAEPGATPTEPPGTEQDLSSGTGFGSPPETSGEPEQSATAPEGFSQQPPVNFQPAETGQSSTEPEQEPQPESPQAPPDFSFGTGTASDSGSSAENSENAGRAEDGSAAFAGGFLGAATDFDSEVPDEQAISESRDSVGSGFGEFLSASADGPAVRKESAENPPEDVVAAVTEPGGTYSQPVPWGPPPTPGKQEQPQAAGTGFAESAPAPEADNSTPQWSGLSAESSSEGQKPFGEAPAAPGNFLEPSEQRPPTGEAGPTAAGGFDSAPATGFVPGAAAPAAEKPGSEAEGFASLDEAPTELGSLSSSDDAFDSSAPPKASGLESKVDDSDGAPVGFDIPPATGSEAPFSSLEPAETESSLFSQSPPESAESLFGTVEQDSPPAPAPGEPSESPGFLDPGSGPADSSLFSDPQKSPGTDMPETFPSAQDNAGAPGAQPAGNSLFPPAAAATEGPAPAPAPLVESRPIGEKGKSRKGLFIAMVVVMGLVSGAALASFVLPVGDYVNQARSFMEKKFMPTATWETAGSESER